MPHDVFISHSSKDFEIAQAACNALENAGIKCWIAPRNIVGDADYYEEIVEGVLASRIMLLVFSANSNASEEVEREVYLAREEKVRVILWRIEDIKPSTKFRLFFAGKQQFNALSRPIKSHLEELVATVNRCLPQKAEASDTLVLPVAPAAVAPLAAAPFAEVEVAQPEETEDDAPQSGAKTNRETFLAQCDEADRDFYTRVLDYCEENRRRVFIDWGGKGFSLKDRDHRPLIWMFPTRNEWMVQVRTLKFTRREVIQVKEMLADNRISGNSWKPRNLPFEQTRDIINLLCRIKPAANADAPVAASVSDDLPEPTFDNDAAAVIFAASETLLTATVDAPEVEAETGRKTTRADFLGQCDEKDGAFFSRVFDYCDANRQKIIIDWGGKGFSLKDRNARPLIWMFPTRGSQWTIQIRTLKFTSREVNQVKDILLELGISGNSWRPLDLPLEKMLDIIALLCKTPAC